MQIVYSKHYDIGFFGIERLHPFDSRKYSRAWGLLRREFGATLSKHWLAVDRPVSDEELLLVHSPEYLASLKNSLTVARAVEIPMLRFMPAWLPRWRVLRPMRWAVRGSVLAARSALETGLAVNLSGGYHHAKPSGGEGFCIFSDIALIVRQLRNERMLGPGDRIVYIDLDAHQGNGVCHEFSADDRVQIFDMYNRDIYPRGDSEARQRIDCNLPLSFNTLGRVICACCRNDCRRFWIRPTNLKGRRWQSITRGRMFLSGTSWAGCVCRNRTFSNGIFLCLGSCNAAGSRR